MLKNLLESILKRKGKELGEAKRRAPWMPDPKEVQARKREERDRTFWGVFEWNPDNRYPETDAKKIFKFQSKAEKYADDMVTFRGMNWVARPIYRHPVPPVTDNPTPEPSPVNEPTATNPPVPGPVGEV